MPYIKKEFREYFQPALDEILLNNPPDHVGELNYLITSICLIYLENQASPEGFNSYSDYNDVIGALECAKLEFYRRKVVAYEEEKIKQNGDL